MNIIFDNWTNFNKIDFMKIIDYFINMNWNYKKILLIFHFLFENHTETFMTWKIIKIFKNYKIENRLFELICDNANNDEKIIVCIKILFATFDIRWNAQINYVFCFVHVVQLSVHALFTFLKTTIKNDLINFIFDEFFVTDIDFNINLSNILFKINFYNKII